jgi:hypothetical protein
MAVDQLRSNRVSLERAEILSVRPDVNPIESRVPAFLIIKTELFLSWSIDLSLWRWDLLTEPRKFGGNGIRLIGTIRLRIAELGWRIGTCKLMKTSENFGPKFTDRVVFGSLRRKENTRGGQFNQS